MSLKDARITAKPLVDTYLEEQMVIQSREQHRISNTPPTEEHWQRHCNNMFWFIIAFLISYCLHYYLSQGTLLADHSSFPPISSWRQPKFTASKD
jgi:hypothetical protein